MGDTTINGQQAVNRASEAVSQEAAPAVRSSGPLASPESVRTALTAAGFEARGVTPQRQSEILQELLNDARDPSKPQVSPEVARELLAQATHAYAGVPLESTIASATRQSNVDNLLTGAERLTTALSERDKPRQPAPSIPAPRFVPGAAIDPPAGRRN